MSTPTLTPLSSFSGPVSGPHAVDPNVVRGNDNTLLSRVNGVIAGKVDRITLSTVFNTDGSITETYLGGVTCVTTFPSATTIVATYTGAISQTITTTFNADGSITEAVT